MKSYIQQLAWQHLKALCLDVGSRIAGTQGDRLAQSYLKTVLGALGYKIGVDRFRFHPPASFIQENLRPYSVAPVSSASVLATNTACFKDVCVLVCAHHDTAPEAPSCYGANDNASGLAVLLTIAAECCRLRINNVQFAALGAEEFCSYGARHILASQAIRRNLCIRRTTAVIMNLDSVGRGKLSLAFMPSKVGSPILNEALDKMFSVLSPRSRVVSMVSGGDALPFIDAGFATLAVSREDFTSRRVLHSPNDLLQLINKRAIEDTVDTALAVITAIPLRR